MSENEKASNFIDEIIIDDLKTGKYQGRVHTRFPPEPNGYLHIGHAKSICMNFGFAANYEGGICNLRFDDTNPMKEEDEFVESIIKDVEWLGFDLTDRIFFASGYFQQLYDYAEQLIQSGDAYVDDQSAEDIRSTRGTLTKAGADSPFRNRTVEENLTLFRQMREGLFKDGEKVLRAKIDMSSANLNMRDPVMYRILHESHHRTGDDWCIYPMYDWAHGLEDSIEKITHSVCTLEFEDHRPLYDWFLIKLGVYRPQQIEFARLNVNYTITSKRKLARLIQEGHVSGWDDPRMPTISALRRRGYTPKSIREFSDKTGVAKRDGVADIALLNHSLREELNKVSERRMAVLDPLRLVITNYPEDQEELLPGQNNPEDESAGNREIPFSRELWVEKSDYVENPPRKFFRLTVGQEVRLKHAYYVTCNEVIKDDDGNVKELHCTYDPATKGGWSDDGRKVRGTMQWVSEKHAVDAEVRLYDHLFTMENPEAVEEGGDFLDNINPDSLVVMKDCKIETSLKDADIGSQFQFLRHGYFCVDRDSSKDKLVFNRTVALRDSWARKQKNK
jgi:glutaminyl-tRNA synthetase